MTDDPSDEALVERLRRAGDERAFATLYGRHTPVLFATAVRLSRDRDAAADAVHDTWVRAVSSLARFEGRSRLRTWLTGILVNCLREQRRERADAASDGADAGEAPDPVAAMPLTDLVVDPLDLEAAIATLPRGFREVLVLHDVHGFTHEEIAELVGIAPGTSKSQLARARRRMRELLTTDTHRIAP